MRLPAYVLGLLVVGPLNPFALTGCADDTDSDQETTGQTLQNQNSGGDASLATQGQDGGLAPDGGEEKGGPVILPSGDPCPACGMG